MSGAMRVGRRRGPERFAPRAFERSDRFARVPAAEASSRHSWPDSAEVAIVRPAAGRAGWYFGACGSWQSTQLLRRRGRPSTDPSGRSCRRGRRAGSRGTAGRGTARTGHHLGGTASACRPRGAASCAAGVSWHDAHGRLPCCDVRPWWNSLQLAALAAEPASASRSRMARDAGDADRLARARPSIRSRSTVSLGGSRIDRGSRLRRRRGGRLVAARLVLPARGRPHGRRPSVNAEWPHVSESAEQGRVPRAKCPLRVPRRRRRRARLARARKPGAVDASEAIASGRVDWHRPAIQWTVIVATRRVPCRLHSLVRHPSTDA